MQELMVCLRTDTLFDYGAKYRLTSHAGKLVKSIPYWLQDRKILLILNTTNYYTSLLSPIRSKLLARASHGQVLCQTCLTLVNYTVPILLQSCERYPKIGYRREQEKMKSWSSTLPVLFVNCQRHSFDSVAKFLLLDCWRFFKRLYIPNHIANLLCEVFYFLFVNNENRSSHGYVIRRHLSTLL